MHKTLVIAVNALIESTQAIDTTATGVFHLFLKCLDSVNFDFLLCT